MSRKRPSGDDASSRNSDQEPSQPELSASESSNEPASSEASEAIRLLSEGRDPVIDGRLAALERSAAELRASLQRIEERTRFLPDGIARTALTVEENIKRITETLTREAARTGDLVRQLTEPLGQRLASVEGRIDSVGETAAELTGASETLRAQLEAIAASQPANAEALATLVSELEGRFSSLDERLSRVATDGSGASEDLKSTLQDSLARVAEQREERERETTRSIEEVREALSAIDERVGRVGAMAEGVGRDVATAREGIEMLAAERGRIDRALREFAEAFRVQMSAAERTLTAALAEGLNRRAAADTEAFGQMRAEIEATRSQLRADMARVFEERAERLASQIVAVMRQPLQDAMSSVRAELSAGRSVAKVQIDEAVATLSGSLDGMAARLDEVRALNERSAAEARSSLDGRLEEVQAHIDGALAGLQSRVDVQSAWGSSLEATKNAVIDLGNDLRTEMAAVASRLREDYTRATTDMESRVQRSIEVLRTAAREAARTAGSELATVVSNVKGDVAVARESAERHQRALEAALERFASLAATVEGMSNRRGFQQLIESERTLLQEQTEFVERLEQGRVAFAAQLQSLGERLERFDEEIASTVRSLRTDTVADLERHRTALRDSVRDLWEELSDSITSLRHRVEELTGPRSDIEAVNNSVEALGLALRGEVKSVGAGLTSVQGTLDDRLREVAEGVRDRVSSLERRLVEAVAAELDRRFETMIRLIEAGIPEVETLVRMTEADRGSEPEGLQPPPD